MLTQDNLILRNTFYTLGCILCFFIIKNVLTIYIEIRIPLIFLSIIEPNICVTWIQRTKIYFEEMYSLHL